MRFFYLVIYLSCLAFLGGGRGEASENRLHFAGFGYEASVNQLDERLPYLSSFLNEANQERLRSALVEAVGLDNDQLILSGLGQLGSGDNAYVFALVFTDELVHTERVGDLGKLLVEVSGQLMAFDFDTGNVAWAKPMSAQYVDVFEQSPSVSEIQVGMEEIIFGDPARSLLGQFSAGIQEIDIGRLDGTTLRVTGVDFSPLAIQQYEAISRLNLETVKAILANRFTLSLVDEQGVAIIPTAAAESGQALGNSMKARMSDGAIYNLVFPEPDFEISFTVDELKKVETGRTGAVVVNVYGVFATFSFIEPLSGRSFFTEQIKFGVSQRLPVSAVVGNDWFAFYEAAEAMFDSFAAEMSGPTNEWARRHITTSRRPLEAMRELEELIQLCR